MILSEPDFSIEALHRAYLKCRRGKRGAINTREFEVKLFNELAFLSETLRAGTYKPSRSVCFYVNKPKLREIFAAHFRDRVVHRLVVDLLEPYYEKKFINDSYACRKDKGTHKAVARTKNFVWRASKKAKAPAYYLQLDVKGYFMQIHKPTLFSILSKEIAPGALLNLLRVIVFHSPADSYVFSGRLPPKDILPPHKTLFHDDKERGVPIGSLTSQFFANIYLNELDQFVKRGLGVRFYIRYVDDFVLLHQDPNQLLLWREKIIKYLQEKLKLHLKNENAMPLSVYKGVDFLGYFIKPRYTLIRRRVKKNFDQKFALLLPLQEKQDGNFQVEHFSCNATKYEKLLASTNSYLGHFHHANSYQLVQAVQKKLQRLKPILYFSKNYLRPVRIISHFDSLYLQIVFFTNTYPKSLILMQVGYYFYGFGCEAMGIAQKFQLRVQKLYKLSYFSIREKRYRFTPNLFSIVMQHCQKSGINVVVIRENEELTPHIKMRLPVLKRTLNKPLQLALF